MSGVLFPICGSCSRVRIRSIVEGSYCAAYPQGMPEIVTQYGFDHRNPLPDDSGIQWEWNGDFQALAGYEVTKPDEATQRELLERAEREFRDRDRNGHKGTTVVLWDGTGDPVDFVERFMDVPQGTYDDLRGMTLEQVQASIAEEKGKRASSR
ncbi:MAG: hypothetical protein M3456_00545 [Actinomycetota bacterium]|nr:hypothetical protein [Actinomycetota bacterium]